MLFRFLSAISSFTGNDCIVHFSVSSADMKYNFNKISTLNQGTPYDYNSVMQYHKYGQSVLILQCIVDCPLSSIWVLVDRREDVLLYHCLFLSLCTLQQGILYKLQLQRAGQTNTHLSQSLLAKMFQCLCPSAKPHKWARMTLTDMETKKK